MELSVAQQEGPTSYTCIHRRPEAGLVSEALNQQHTRGTRRTGRGTRREGRDVIVQFNVLSICTAEITRHVKIGTQSVV